jgi:hypothetical protein
MKKLAALAGSAALLLGMAGSVLAFGPEVEDNWAGIYNRVYSRANSGGNEIGGMFVHGGTIVTGDAWASSLLSNTVNSLEGCGCGLFTSIDDNGAHLYNSVKAKANSGYNSIGGKFVFGGTIVSGGAGAESLVSNVVNSIVTPD